MLFATLKPPKGRRVSRFDVYSLRKVHPHQEGDTTITVLVSVDMKTTTFLIYVAHHHRDVIVVVVVIVVIIMMSIASSTPTHRWTMPEVLTFRAPTKAYPFVPPPDITMFSRSYSTKSSPRLSRDGGESSGHSLLPLRARCLVCESGCALLSLRHCRGSRSLRVHLGRQILPHQLGSPKRSLRVFTLRYCMPKALYLGRFEPCGHMVESSLIPHGHGTEKHLKSTNQSITQSINQSIDQSTNQ